jgi:hypothetical protein
LIFKIWPLQGGAPRDKSPLLCLNKNYLLPQRFRAAASVAVVKVDGLSIRILEKKSLSEMSRLYQIQQAAYQSEAHLLVLETDAFPPLIKTFRDLRESTIKPGLWLSVKTLRAVIA